MADYIYLLENRLSAGQRAALLAVREVAKAKGLTLFLVGGAVRDLTSGSPVRDLDVVVQGNALKLKKEIATAGGVIAGEYELGQSLFVRFPGSVRMEIASTLSVTYPKPGKPVFKPATILDDLRRRDFTVNAMALSLNEGSYGLLMDPLNGVADIENRQLRLVSNYGFIEDPVRMIRAARLMARLGWTLDEKTQARYDAGKDEGYISVLSDHLRGYETEEIVHEEDPLRVLKRLEAEGWMQHLAPDWTSAKVNVTDLERLRETQTQLQMQGIHPDPAAANFPLLTAKLTPKEIDRLKASFPRKGFVAEIESLEAEAKDFTNLLGAKNANAPSVSWKLITSASAEAVLFTAFSTKSGTIQAKFKSFYNEWPQARHKIPYTIMQEMRITKDLPVYNELLEKLFFELMDGRLESPEEIKAFLEPYSPPAPPPPVSMRRPKAAKIPKGRARKVKLEDSESEQDEDDLLADMPSDPDETGGAAGGVDAEDDGDADADAKDEDSSEDDAEPEPAPEKGSPKSSVKAASTSVNQVIVAPPPSPAVKPAAPAALSRSTAKVPAKASGAAVPARPEAAKAVPAAKPSQKVAAKKSVMAKAAAKPAPTASTASTASKSLLKPGTAQKTAKSPAPPAKGTAQRSKPTPLSKAVKKVAPVKPPAKKTAAKAAKSSSGKVPAKATRRR